MSTAARRLMPSLGAYERRFLRSDLVAGIATASVVAPQAMAYADLAGLPVQLGLYTAIFPMILYVVLGASRPLSVSTTSTIAVLTGAALASLGPLSQAQLGGAASTLALLVGAFLLLASLLRLGFLSNFISVPVLTGFKAGIGIVIVVGQLGKLFGVPLPKGGSVVENLTAFVRGTGLVSVPTLVLSLATLALLLALRRWAPRVPGPLVAVVLGIGVAVVLAAERLGIATVGGIPSGLPAPALPELGYVGPLWLPAVGIALMAFVESTAAAKAFMSQDDPPIASNRELLALGAANAAGALFQAMPAGGGTSQSAVNHASGARSQLASAAGAVLVMGVLLFLAPLLSSLPQATLGAIVLLAAVGLVDLRAFGDIASYHRPELRWAVVATLGVTLIGTLQGIALAVMVSFMGLIHLADLARIERVGRDPKTGALRTATPDAPVEPVGGLVIVRPQGVVYFGNAERLRERLLEAVRAAKGTRVLLVDTRTIPYLEYTGLRMFGELVDVLEREGVSLWVSDVQPETRAALARRLARQEGGARVRFFHHAEDALAAFEGSGTSGERSA